MFKRYNVDYNVNEKTLDRIGRIAHEVKTILNESEISRKDNYVYCNFDGLTVAGKGIYVTSDNGERTEYAFNLRIVHN